LYSVEYFSKGLILSKMLSSSLVILLSLEKNSDCNLHFMYDSKSCTSSEQSSTKICTIFLVIELLLYNFAMNFNIISSIVCILITFLSLALISDLLLMSISSTSVLLEDDASSVIWTFVNRLFNVGDALLLQNLCEVLKCFFKDSMLMYFLKHSENLHWKLCS